MDTQSISFAKPPYGSSSGVVEIVSSADGFFKFFTREDNHVSDDLRFQIESKDLEKRTVTLSILGDIISETYKTVKATFTVIPTEEELNHVRWIVEFEKIHHNIEEAELVPIVDILMGLIERVDIELCVLNISKADCFIVESPADECFKALIEACKDDANVEIETEDWEKRISKMSLRRSHSLMSKYEALKVTTTIDPQEHGDGSLVNIAIDCKKIGDTADPDLALDTSICIELMIQTSLGK